MQNSMPDLSAQRVPNCGINGSLSRRLKYKSDLHVV